MCSVIVVPSGPSFRHVLNYLRAPSGSSKFALPAESHAVEQLSHEAEFYCLAELAAMCGRNILGCLPTVRDSQAFEKLCHGRLRYFTSIIPPWISLGHSRVSL